MNSQVWLFQFGLEGVQRFLSEARKTRDLAAGSEIVQRCAQNAVAAARKSPNSELLLPSSDAALTNRLVVRVAGDEDAVRNFATSVTTAVRGVLQDCLGIWKGEQAELDSTVKKYVLSLVDDFERARDVCDEQIGETVGLYWVAVPQTNGYRSGYEKLTTAYAARKNTRSFRQTTAAFDENLQPHDERPRGRNWTCSQCGKRVAVADARRGNLGVQPERDNFYRAGDRLCAVCLGKREYGRSLSKSPPSTHALAQYRLRRSRFFNNLREARYPDHYWELDRAELAAINDETAKKAAEELWAEDRPAHSSYYALVALDGDRMGRLFAVPGEGDDLYAHQQSVAKALAGFGNQLNRAAGRHSATPVYAGGDDFLLLCPLDSALPLLEELFEEWEGAPIGTSLSAVVSVHHQKAPFDRAVVTAWEEVDRVKGAFRSVRDSGLEGFGSAFGIAAHIRAGEHSLAVGWSEEMPVLTGVVEAFCNWRRGDHLSAGGFPPDVSARIQLSRRLLHSIRRAGCLRHVQTARVLADLTRLYESSGESATEAWQAVLTWVKCHRGGWEKRNSAGSRGLEERDHSLSVLAFLCRELAW